ncbi:hypothetical protein CDAR_278881 [Caerostris darwini]|uniref:Uncharacterized protein n=1 Tax=Caerostris darwini TaxID=1538125 RepID=A0AAV4WPP2_9ARAC|nr:hypothetical protein CDAR_278881 [Caerostris darwini]
MKPSNSVGGPDQDALIALPASIISRRYKQLPQIETNLNCTHAVLPPIHTQTIPCHGVRCLYARPPRSRNTRALCGRQDKLFLNPFPATEFD